jgi:hypothetical protein
MSRFTVTKWNPPVPNEPEEYAVYEYGYDSQLMYYFLTMIATNIPGLEAPQELVGPLSDKYGNKSNLHEVMKEHRIWDLIPNHHRNDIVLDLPIGHIDSDIDKDFYVAYNNTVEEA